MGQTARRTDGRIAALLNARMPTAGTSERKYINAAVVNAVLIPTVDNRALRRHAQYGSYWSPGGLGGDSASDQQSQRYLKRAIWTIDANTQRNTQRGAPLATVCQVTDRCTCAPDALRWTLRWGVATHRSDVENRRDRVSGPVFFRSRGGIRGRSKRKVLAESHGPMLGGSDLRFCSP